MNWLIPFPGDWHVCKNYQKVLRKIYWHAGLKDMAEKAGTNIGEIHYHKENKTNGLNRLNSVQKATNLKKKIKRQKS